MVGYSDKSLLQKLGIKSHSTILLLDFPTDYPLLLGTLPQGIRLKEKLEGRFDFIQYFVTEKVLLEKRFPLLKRHLKSTAALWISWPKGSSGKKTDLNENVIRNIGLTHGLVDVKVIAVDDTWSGLKFIFRLKDRYI